MSDVELPRESIVSASGGATLSHAASTKSLNPPEQLPEELSLKTNLPVPTIDKQTASLVDGTVPSSVKINSEETIKVLKKALSISENNITLDLSKMDPCAALFLCNAGPIVEIGSQKNTSKK